jgi:NADH-quinone oxidoreductase subunit C
VSEGDRASAAAVVAERVGEGAEVGDAFGLACVDVSSGSWVAALTAARDDAGCAYFDWLSAVDELDEGFSVVAHVWSVDRHEHVLLRTRVPRATPHLQTATTVFRGANWHERETHEMFGIVFDGHPNLVPLLLPDGFEGNPLRKEFVLAARVAKPWPGAKEPGESDAGQPVARGRRRMRPPGVPEPDEWGPRPPGSDG